MNDHDNATSHLAAEYDGKISATIPFYELFHKAVVDLAQNSDIAVDKWLDTGCGTGNLLASARTAFPKTEFILADPSGEMLKIAQDKLAQDPLVSFANAGTQDLPYDDNIFDVITAIQSHHYLSEELRRQAVKNCFRMLKPGGVFITFENIRPLSEKGIRIGLKRWAAYQVRCGKTVPEAKQHMDRFDQEYFPVTIIDHLNLFKDAGFNSAEVLWASYLQAGFYSIK